MFNSLFDIFYEVVNPATQKTDFVTEDRFIAETHYERGYTVYENRRTMTKHSTFNYTITYSTMKTNTIPMNDPLIQATERTFRRDFEKIKQETLPLDLKRKAVQERLKKESEKPIEPASVPK